MITNLLEELETTIHKYCRFRDEAAFYPAFQCIAIVHNFSKDWDSIECLQLKAHIAQEEFPQDFIDSVLQSLKKDLQRLQRILTVGGHCTNEEVLLIITLRIEIWHVMGFLRDKSLMDNENLEAECKISDELITEAMKRNKEQFESEMKRVQKINPIFLNDLVANRVFKTISE